MGLSTVGRQLAFREDDVLSGLGYLCTYIWLRCITHPPKDGRCVPLLKRVEDDDVSFTPVAFTKKRDSGWGGGGGGGRRVRRERQVGNLMQNVEFAIYIFLCGSRTDKAPPPRFSDDAKQKE